MIRTIHARDDYYSGGLRYAIVFNCDTLHLELPTPHNQYTRQFLLAFIRKIREFYPGKEVEYLLDLYEYLARCTLGKPLHIFSTTYACYHEDHKDLLGLYYTCLLRRLTQRQFSKR